MQERTEKPKVGLFVTCLVDLYRPSVGFATIKLLESAGCEVIVPAAQTCCGQPAYNNGDTANARVLAKQVLSAFADVDYVVAPSGSCAGMLKRHFPHLLTTEPAWQAKAQQFANRCYELISFLTEVRGITAVTAHFPTSVTYHDACAGLRELNIKRQPRQLLHSVTGLTVHEMPDNEVCCGFGGTFCIKYSDISTRMVSDKVENICNSGAKVVLAGEMGCLLNIAGRLKRLAVPVKAYHVAEVLADMATDTPAIGEEQDS